VKNKSGATAMRHHQLANLVTNHDDAKTKALAIHMQDEALPLLVGLLRYQQPQQCAEIIVELLRLRGGNRQHALTFIHGEVFLERADSIERPALAVLVDAATDPTELARCFESYADAQGIGRHSETSGYRISDDAE